MSGKGIYVGVVYGFRREISLYFANTKGLDNQVFCKPRSSFPSGGGGQDLYFVTFSEACAKHQSIRHYALLKGV